MYRLAELVADPDVPVGVLSNSNANKRVLLGDERLGLARAARELERFDVSDAAAWYNDDDAISSDFREWPPMRLPYPKVWVEMTVPKEHLSQFPFDVKVVRYGAFLVEGPVRGKVLDLAGRGDPANFVDVPEGVEVATTIQTVLQFGTTVVMPATGFSILSTVDGRLIEFHLLALDEDMGYAVEIDKTVVRPALFGLALAGVKGSRISQPSTSPQCRKRRRQQGSSLSYRVITLPGTRSSGSRGGRPGNKGLIPMHLVRGHFATYTDTAPLFGKRTGTYWRPAHVRGNAEQGLSDKDYRVKRA
jgi:hypothetical protein